MIYLLIVNIAIAIGYALYQLSFRNLTFFQWNRFYLLGLVIVSLLIPIGLFIDFASFIPANEVIPVMDISSVIDVPMVMYVDKSFYLKDLLALLYLIGLAIASIHLLYQLFLVRKVFRSRMDYLSFSFFNKIFLGQKVISNEVIGAHERVHVDQGHSYDVAFIELVKVFNWFNPVLYYLAKELKLQHECIADQLCSEDKVAYAELLVANAMQVERITLVHEFSNHSFLKKRIMMLFKNKSSSNKKFLYLSVAPMLLVIAGSTLVFNTSRAKDVVRVVENQISDVKLTDRVEETKLGSYYQESALISAEILPEQKDKESIVQDTSKGKIFTSTEINPEPPGGMVAFRKWIADNYQYPMAAIENAVKGTLQLSFIVEKDGTFSDLKVVRDLGFGLGNAGLALLEKAPKWSPAIQNGKPVRVQYLLPIKMDLSDRDEIKRATPDLGYYGLQNWLSDNYVAPQAVNIADPVMYASFLIRKDGSYDYFDVKTDLDKSFSDALISLLKKSKWKLSEENGEKNTSRASLVVKLDKNGKIIRNYERVEVLPEPKNGMAAFLKYLNDNLKYPEELSKDEISVFSYNFVVDKDGKFKPTTSSSSKSDNKVGAQVLAEVAKLVDGYGNWYPAIIDGQKVEVSYSLSVIFNKGQIQTSMGGGVFNKSSLVQ